MQKIRSILPLFIGMFLMWLFIYLKGGFNNTIQQPRGFRDNAEKYCIVEGGVPVVYPISKDSREETVGCQFDISPIYKK